MRFIENGTDIPDELLLARDEGRVVFFCGSGVSRAKAGLPDFYGLAYEVIDSLGVPLNHAIRKILKEIKHFEENTETFGLISVDRVFGLLERDFDKKDINRAVSEALNPVNKVENGKIINLKAHEILLDLATTQTGKAKLITTNFDRLFECCDDSLDSYVAPNLPNLNGYDEIHGIIHLHGIVNEDYSSSQSDSFILTSSEFGVGYLSDGWATKFMKTILEQYVVVFIGYTADDPPIHYLLEALNRNVGKKQNIYAFQENLNEELLLKWTHKGVQPIPYNVEEEHKPLWDTLLSWSIRAKNPNAWYEHLVSKAKNDPMQMLPFERGQITHIISSIEGAKKFCLGETVPSAEWLCVFDANIRCSLQEMNFITGTKIYPFDTYQLDSDKIPDLINSDNQTKSRETLQNAWDAFKITSEDMKNAANEHFSTFRGKQYKDVPNQLKRLSLLETWLIKISNQPLTLWWASHQLSLHQHVIDRIKYKLLNDKPAFNIELRKGWQYLFEYWQVSKRRIGLLFFDLNNRITNEGWNSSVCYEFIKITKPYIKVKPIQFYDSIYSDFKKNIRLRDILSSKVYYPKIRDFIVPDEHIYEVLLEFSQNLQLGFNLEKKLESDEFLEIGQLNPTEIAEWESFVEPFGIQGQVQYFISLFERLIEIDIALAQKEFQKWLLHNGYIYERLIVFALPKKELVSKQMLRKILLNLSNKLFLGSDSSSDLLIAISSRWEDLSKTTQRAIEKRLFSGNKEWDEIENEKAEEYKSKEILNRIHWLINNGCKFNIDFERVKLSLKSKAKDWNESYISESINPTRVRAYSVQTDTTHDDIKNIPLNQIINKAKELSGRDRDLNFHIEKRPYSGLVADIPIRAFSALNYSAKKGQYPEWAWSAFLYDNGRERDEFRFKQLIAHRILEIPDESLSEIIRPITSWIYNTSKKLNEECIKVFNLLIEKIILFFETNEDSYKTSISKRSILYDLTSDALNSSVGDISRSLFYFPKRLHGKSFSSQWIDYVQRLLNLQGTGRLYSLVLFSYYLNWFYSIDKKWTKEHLINALNTNETLDSYAFWSGFFWRSETPRLDLYIILKSFLLELATTSLPFRRGYSRSLSRIIFAGWRYKEENSEPKETLVTNNELKTAILNSDENFKVNLIYILRDFENLIPYFFKHVWPIQIKVRTSKISAELCMLMFSSSDNFSQIFNSVSRFLTKVNRNDMDLSMGFHITKELIEKNSEDFLALLDKILSDDAGTWPYGTNLVLDMVVEVDSRLKSDKRYIRLSRIWNSQ